MTTKVTSKPNGFFCAAIVSTVVNEMVETAGNSKKQHSPMTRKEN